MKNRLLFLSLACVMANAMIKVEIVGLAGPKCICDMRRDQTIEEVKQEVVLKTDFVATDILKGTEHLDFKATLGDIAQGKSEIQLTCVATVSPLEELRQIPQLRDYDLEICKKEESLRMFVVIKIGKTTIEIEHYENDQEKILRALLCMEDFNPQDDYTGFLLRQKKLPPGTEVLHEGYKYRRKKHMGLPTFSFECWKDGHENNGIKYHMCLPNPRKSPEYRTNGDLAMRDKNFYSYIVKCVAREVAELVANDHKISSSPSTPRSA